MERMLSAHRLRAISITIALTALAYVGLSMWSGKATWLAVLQQIGAGGIALALCLSLLNYGLRFVRWHYYGRVLGERIPMGDNLGIYLAGFALTPTPGKAGEAVRGLFLKARHGVGHTRSLAMFFSERLSDLIGMLLLTLPGIALYPSGQWLVWLLLVGIVAGMLLLGHEQLLITLLAWLSRHVPRLAKVIHHFEHLLVHTRACLRPGRFFLTTTLSLLGWLAEASAFYLMLHWMGYPLSLELAAFIFAFAMVAGALTFLPGGLGGAEVTMVTLLLLAGVAQGPALAVTVLIRLTTLWFAVFLGCAALLWLQRHGVKEKTPNASELVR